MNLCSKALRIHSRLRNKHRQNAEETQRQNRRSMLNKSRTDHSISPGLNVLSRSEQAIKVNLHEIYCDEVMAIA